MNRSAFIRGLLDDPRDPQLPQSVPQNDFGPRAYGLLNALFPDPYVSAGEAVQQFRAGNPIDAFETMVGVMPATGAMKSIPKAAKAAEAVSEAAPAGIIAYHGSPHSFDRFDMSKIGTGEGAQAYGHGLYFADNEAVARDYRNKLADAVVPDEIASALASIDNAGFETPKSALTYIRANPDWQKHLKIDPAKEGVAAQTIAEHLSAPAGSMYQVKINADPEHFLDWDKPLSEQSPVVQQVIDKIGAADEAKYGYGGGAHYYMTDPDSHSGADLYRYLSSQDDQAKAVQPFQGSGIPGIKYLDQGSRVSRGHKFTVQPTYKGKPYGDPQVFDTSSAANNYAESVKADGFGADMTHEPIQPVSRNYVVFDDNLVEILKKYGLIGLLGGGAAMSASQSPNAQQGAPLL